VTVGLRSPSATNRATVAVALTFSDASDGLIRRYLQARMLEDGLVSLDFPERQFRPAR
jgi:hypothetical protein